MSFFVSFGKLVRLLGSVCLGTRAREQKPRCHTIKHSLSFAMMRNFKPHFETKPHAVFMLECTVA